MRSITSSQLWRALQLFFGVCVCPYILLHSSITLKSRASPLLLESLSPSLPVLLFSVSYPVHHSLSIFSQELKLSILLDFCFLPLIPPSLSLPLCLFLFQVFHYELNFSKSLRPLFLFSLFLRIHRRFIHLVLVMMCEACKCFPWIMRSSGVVADLD